MGDESLQRVIDEIHQLGLDQNLIELETRGFTTIQQVLSEESVSRARDAILARVERTSGHKIDILTETGESLEGSFEAQATREHEVLLKNVTLELAPGYQGAKFQYALFEGTGGLITAKDKPVSGRIKMIEGGLL